MTNETIKKLWKGYEQSVKYFGMKLAWSDYAGAEIDARIAYHVERSGWTREPMLVAMLADWNVDMIADIRRQFEIERSREQLICLEASSGSFWAEFIKIQAQK